MAVIIVVTLMFMDSHLYFHSKQKSVLFFMRHFEHLGPPMIFGQVDQLKDRPGLIPQSIEQSLILIEIVPHLLHGLHTVTGVDR